MHDLRWSKGRTKQLLARLGSVLSECKLRRVIGGAKVSDYADLIENTPGKILSDGYMNALYITVISLLLAIPNEERVEIAFEQQDRYSALANATLEVISTARDPHVMTSDGKPKLAKWSFLPKQSTMLFDQADYLCYALLQKCRNEESKKAIWCSPILEGGGAIGEIYSRERIRNVIQKHNQSWESGKVWE